MYKTIQTFLKRGRKPAKNAVKGLLEVALFGVIVAGSLFPMGIVTSLGTAAPAIAHAATCAIATAISNDVNNATPNVGDTVTFTLDGAPSFTDPTHEIVTDLLPADLTFVSASASTGTYNSVTGIWDLGTMNGANAIELTITAKVNSGTEGKTITTTPSVQYVQSSCTESSAVESASIKVHAATPAPVPAETDLSIVKTVDNATPYEGDVIHYTVTAKDLGPATSTGVVATDTLPSGLTFVSATTSVGSYSSTTGVWTIGDMSTSSAAILSIAAVVNSGTASTTITNIASISQLASITDPKLSNNSSSVSLTVQRAVVVSPSADISIAKAVDVTSTNEGVTVHYTIMATDLGPATSTGVVATDTLPAGLTFVSANPSTGTYATSTGTWTIGDLSPNATATLEIAATVATGTAGTTIVNTATITEATSTIDKNLTNNTATASFVVKSIGGGVCSVAAAFTDSVDNATPHVGDVITYTLTGAPSLTASTTILVTDLLGSGLTFVSASATPGTYSSSTGIWNLGTLNGASTATLILKASVNAGTEGRTIANTPSVEYVQVNCTQSSAVVGAPITVQGGGGGGGSSSADIAVAKTVDNATPNAGAIVHYTVAVGDHGPDAAVGVSVHDVLPSPALSFVSATTSQGSYSTSTGDWTVGTVGANATATMIIAAQVASDQAGKTIVNTATAIEASSISDPNPANNSSSVSIAVASLPFADISVTKTADASTSYEGGTIRYTIAVTDLGPATSTGVVATDTLPSGLTLVNATASVGNYATSTGAWTIGDLSPNATATLEIAATVATGTAGNTIVNTATVTEATSTIDKDLTNNSSSVSVIIFPKTCGSSCSLVMADIAVAKTVDNATPSAGSTVNYTVMVTNKGPATSTFVKVQDQLPPTTALSLLSATTSQGSAYNVSTGEWDVGTVGPNATATMQIAVVVGSNQAGNTIVNTATVSQLSSIFDPDLSNNSSTVSITVPSSGCTSNCGGGGGGGGTQTAEIGIVKTVDNANPAAGATIHYTLTVSAMGPSPSIAVVASDTLPVGVTFVSASSSVGTYDHTTGIWTIGNLNSSQTATLAVTATVNASDTPGQTITNTGTVKESLAVNDQNSSNNTSSVTITVAGGGGGGGGGGGTVLGTSTSTTAGKVLGATSCGLYLTKYIHPVRKDLNDPVEVKKLQTFLNGNLGTTLPITGYYGSQTIAAVNQFQTKYHSEVLVSWVPLGLPTEFTPTSYVYQTTWRWINLIMCPSLNLPMPSLKLDNSDTATL